MPEQNFEQQARDMANGFNMEPKPELWQNVRNAIQPPERKRRFVLWWWLLPIALIGGAGAYYTLTGQQQATQQATINTAEQKTNDNQSIDNNKLTPDDSSIKQQDNSKKEISKEKSTASDNTQNNNNIHIASSSTVTNAFGKKRNEKTGNQFFKKKAVVTDVTGRQTVNDDKVSTQNNNNTTTVLSPVITDKESYINDGTLSIANPQTSNAGDSLSSVSSAKDFALPQTISTSNAAQVITPKKRTALQWGLIAEGGIAARKSSVFSIVNAEKSLDARPAPQNFDAITSGFLGLTNGGTSVSFSNNIKHGAALSLGVALQKKLNRSVDVFADVTYDYQSYKITSTAYKDSLLLNYSFNTLLGSYKATQSFNFAAVFAGINWHFVNTSKMQFGISAGIDNLLLLSARQKINSVSNSSFSVQRMQGLSDSTFTKNNFYNYQPSLFAGVMVNIKTGKRQWQLVPFARSSWRPFDKTITSSNNHLFSAGLRAVCFFK